VPHVRLKGLEQFTKRLKDGRHVTYWYAWRGGPRLPGQPGSPEFMAAYNAAVAVRRAPGDETLTGLVARYRASPDWSGLADTTRKHWSRFLDKIAATEGDLDIGDLTFRALDDRRVRAEVLDWRDQWATKTRTADYAMQVLSRVLAFGVERGLLAYNAAAGVRQLYASERADQVWTEGEVARFTVGAGSPEVGFIVRLACLTGLRRTDLARLAWSHVGDAAIIIPTGKSRGRKTAVIPILPATRELLAEIKTQQAARMAELVARARKKGRPEPAQPVTVLANTRAQPWTASGLEHQVVDVKATCRIERHLHDARGTFATRLRRAGLTAPEIADVLGWEEERVERLLTTYVDRDEIVLALAKRIEWNERGSKGRRGPRKYPERSKTDPAGTT
jgi:integrase